MELDSMSRSELDKKILPKALRLLFEHQRWLNSQGRFGRQLVAEGLKFINLDLDGVDLSYARLPYAYFEGGSMRGCRFVGTFLHSATFDKCDIEETDFTNADLRWAIFETNHEQACFDKANLYRTAWTLEEGHANSGIYALTLLTPTPGIVPEGWEPPTNDFH
jgi:uncharacterized protein YjbI with pentapeptide repeats